MTRNRPNILSMGDLLGYTETDHAKFRERTEADQLKAKIANAARVGEAAPREPEVELRLGLPNWEARAAEQRRRETKIACDRLASMVAHGLSGGVGRRYPAPPEELPSLPVAPLRVDTFNIVQANEFGARVAELAGEEQDLANELGWFESGTEFVIRSKAA